MKGGNKVVAGAFFKENPKVALAFSGGVDSAYLLYAAIACGAEVSAYYVKTPFQPQFEYEDAMKLAKQLGAKMTVLEIDVLSDPEIAENPKNRCYYCKKKLFSAICKQAEVDGFSVIIDGTNASDDPTDRPGMQALTELQVRSPLRELGLTKKEIRKLSKEAGLFTHDKPAYACLATRIPANTPITKQALAVTERSEDFLRKLGFTDFRVRFMEKNAKIQLREEDFPLFFKHRETIVKELKKDYVSVLLDLEARP